MKEIALYLVFAEGGAATLLITGYMFHCSWLLWCKVKNEGQWLLDYMKFRKE